MKKKAAPVTIVLILAALVAAVGVVTWVVQSRTPSKQHMDLDTCFCISSDDQVALTADGAVSETPGKMIDGTVYFPYDTVISVINKRFYYDEEEKLIDVTTPTQFVSETLDDSNTGDARTEDGTLYLSLPFIRKYTDMECTELTDPQRVVITTKFPYQAAVLTEDAAIRHADSIRADIVEDGKKDEELRIVDADADAAAGISVNSGWTHVVTSGGIVGYAETKSLGEAYEGGTDHVSTVGAYTDISKDYKINMAFYQADNADSNAFLEQKLEGTKGITTISPTWFFLNGTGDVTSIADEDFVKKAHAGGYEVWALLNDFGAGINSKDATYAVLKGTSSRTAVISKILSEAERTGIDGINVDIEHVSKEGAAAYLEFIRELSVECRNRGLVLSTDTVVPMSYNAYLDFGEQGTVADYVVVMCYDEHYKGSKEAGSVASLPYVTNGLADIEKKMKPEKVIAGIPFYTRLWQTIDSGEPSSQLMTMEEAETYVTEHNMSRSWDEKTSQNYAELNDENGYWQIWLEDEESIAAKMKAVRDSGAAGVAEWRLGDEKSGIWPVIAEYLQ